MNFQLSFSKHGSFTDASRLHTSSDPRLFFFDDLSSFSRFDGHLTFSFVFIHPTDLNWDSCQGLMQPTHVM